MCALVLFLNSYVTNQFQIPKVPLFLQGGFFLLRIADCGLGIADCGLRIEN
jgi:hypothetical protein